MAPKVKTESTAKKAPKMPTVSESATIIPTSRIKSIIADPIVNKSVIDTLDKIKTASEFKTDLDKLLSDQDRELIGKFIAKSESSEAARLAKGGSVDKPISGMTPYEVATAAIARTKLKFSKNSFQVVGIVLDSIIYDLSKSTMDNMLANTTTTNISTKFVCPDVTSLFYPVYANSKVLLSLNKDAVSETAEVAETESAEVESDSKSVNFECYIKKIVDNVRGSDTDKYIMFKNSSVYKKFCSDLIIDILERVSKIIMVLSTGLQLKTINDKIFITVFEMLITDHTGVIATGGDCEKHINTVLSDLKKK